MGSGYVIFHVESIKNNTKTKRKIALKSDS